MSRPDPISDPDGYALWREAHPCTACDGTGEVAGDGDEPGQCETCDGTGVNPYAGDDELEDAA